MGKTAYLFPGQGQGTVQIGMGKELYKSSKKARLVVDMADRILGWSLSKLCFEGPKEKLLAEAQLAVFVMNLAYLSIYSKIRKEKGDLIFVPNGCRPSFLAGHSVGYIAALVGANSLTLLPALHIVTVRKTAMRVSSEINPGKMLVLIDLKIDEIERRCAEFGVDIANENSDTQFVISGLMEPMIAIEEVIRRDNLARMILPLETEGGAYHSRCMRPAVKTLSACVEQITFAHPKIPIIGNSRAQLIKTGEEAREEVLVQLCSCVHWRQSMDFLDKEGVTTTIEMCGSVLSKNLERSTKRKKLRKIISASVAFAKKRLSQKRLETPKPGS